MLVTKLSHVYKNTFTPVEDATAAGHKEKSRVNNFTKVQGVKRQKLGRCN